MTLKELEDAGVLLPRDKWRKRPVKTRVPRLPLLIVGALVPVSVASMYLGDGGAVTWVGLGIFFATLIGFTWASLRGIR